MKRSLLIFAFFNFLIATAVAQPQRRRTTTQQQSSTSAAQKSNANTMTTRAQLSFPTQATMSEDVVWRRDIYREVDLHDDANAGLYYPKEPVGTQMNLFTYIFKLMMRGTIKAYEYRLDGNELFTDSARIKPLQFLKDQGIYFERTDKGVRLEDSDIPSKEVTAYYIKESAYYDPAPSTVHTKALALCPIWVEEWGGESERKPLFWVKYDELAPFLAKQTIMTSNLNNAATMSIDDFFTLNMYKGKNLQDQQHARRVARQDLRQRLLEDFCRAAPHRGRAERVREPHLGRRCQERLARLRLRGPRAQERQEVRRQPSGSRQEGEDCKATPQQRFGLIVLLVVSSCHRPSPEALAPPPKPTAPHLKVK